MPDTQDEQPLHRIQLEKVGISNLKTLIKIEREGQEFRHIPLISIFMDLDEMKKGIHMSRLVESITEILEEEVSDKHTSLELIGRHVLETLKEKHGFMRGGIEFISELPIHEITPVSQKETIEIHAIEVTVLNHGDEWVKELKVSVLGNTVCPHALSTTEGRTHIQRATGQLEIKTDFDNEIALEDMVEAVEQSFSSKIYTLLKTEDETCIVNTMYDNPLFVEDVCRNMLAHSSQRFTHCSIHAKCISNESIHRHDVYAEGSVKT
jgi:GTP cyclohydrolase-4